MQWKFYVGQSLWMVVSAHQESRRSVALWHCALSHLLCLYPNHFKREIICCFELFQEILLAQGKWPLKQGIAYAKKHPG